MIKTNKNLLDYLRILIRIKLFFKIINLEIIRYFLSLQNKRCCGYIKEGIIRNANNDKNFK